MRADMEEFAKIQDAYLRNALVEIAKAGARVSEVLDELTDLCPSVGRKSAGFREVCEPTAQCYGREAKR